MWSTDVSNDLAISSNLWNNVIHNDNFIPTPTTCGTMVALHDGVSFLVIGGLTEPANYYTTQAWEQAAIIDASSKIWLWGGVSDYHTGYHNITYWNAFATLNSNNWLWYSVDFNGYYPDSGIGHTMTMTSNGIIILIGGRTAHVENTLSPQGYITASGAIPQARNLHSAILAIDGNTIIIFGRANSDYSAVFNDLYSYDSGKLSGQIEPAQVAQALELLTMIAVQVNQTMFIMFGWDSTSAPLEDIYGLDTVNWIWVAGYRSYRYPPISGEITTSNALSTGAIAGISLGVIGTGILLLWFIRRKKRNSPQHEQATSQKPVMGECPLPPPHSKNDQRKESPFNDSSLPGSNGTYYHRTSKTCSSLGGITSECTIPSPPYCVSNYGSYFISKPEAHDVPDYIVQPNKPNEDV
ncbi:hypothetical protein BGW37DRAFT_524351 [Umbelopsis sp. PMI_123]|nr:hypothetical protein BGW37DRAFT_524351 [Umbelopsis sp. PMI_123]